MNIFQEIKHVYSWIDKVNTNIFGKFLQLLKHDRLSLIW
jgi:hypothetical protein